MTKIVTTLILIFLSLSAALLSPHCFPHGQAAGPLDKSRLAIVDSLKALAEAMFQYAQTDKHRRFPPAELYSNKGDALLSWRVLLLPYLDQGNLFKGFHLDEAWDSPHNKKLLPRMPNVYQRPGGKADETYLTPYQVFVGKSAAFTGKVGQRMPDDFKDGAGNTLLIVEAAEPVPWTKPADLRYDAKKPLPKLGSQGVDVFGAVFADGTMAFLPKRIPESVLRGFITRNGGEKVDRRAFLGP